MNYVKLWWTFTKIELKKWNEYKVDFLLISLASLMNIALGIFNIRIIFSKVDSILGWNEYEVIWMLGYYMIIESIFHTFFINCFDTSSWIYSGRMDLLKIRPSSVVFQLLFFERYNTEYPIDTFVASIILLIWSGKKLVLDWSIGRIIGFILSIIISTIIYTCIVFIISSLSFWTIKSNYITEFILELEEICRYPIAAYGRIVMYILTYVIPIGFVCFYPCQFLLMHKEYYVYSFFSPLVAIVLLVISILIWKHGISRYESPNS